MNTEPHPVADNPPAPNAIGSPKQTVRQRRWLYPAVAAGVLCAVGLALFEIRVAARHPTEIHSLAVLPLRDLSPDPGQEYFADGITEEIITELAQSLPLRVISRTSVTSYKRTEKSISQIARELGVEAVVEGAVTRSGDRVSVTVQLIDANEDRHLWAQKYDRRLEDIMSIEEELSQAIATQVSGTLNLRRARLTTARPVDPQVYELCLMGLYHWNKRTAADLDKSEEYYKRATELDPAYAPAYAGLADVYALRPSYDATPWLDSLEAAVAAAHHALELDETLAEAHATLGFVGLNWRSAWPQSDHELRRALELDPNYANAHHWFAYDLFYVGRKNEAIAEIDAAQQLDPLSAVINADRGHFLYAVRRYDEARKALRRSIELAPELGRPHTTFALVELETGHTPEALAEARAGLALDPGNPRTVGEAAYVLAATGNTAVAEELLATLKQQVNNGRATGTFVALVEIGLGQRAEALDTLERMQESDVGGPLIGLNQWHAFDALGTDSRYRKLLAQTR